MTLRAAALTCLAALVLAGCASAPLSGSASALALSVTVDRAEYDIGSPLVATVHMENKARAVIDVPRFDPRSLQFMYGGEGVSGRAVREPVYSDLVAAEPRRLEPGSAISRQFLFTRLTEKKGTYALIASFKGAFAEGKVIDEALFSPPATYRVSGKTALRRDPFNGLILKDHALELARAHAKGTVKSERAVLVELEKSGLYAWVVLIEETAKDGTDRKLGLVVDAYTGTVKPLERAAANSPAGQGPEGLSPPSSGGRGGAPGEATERSGDASRGQPVSPRKDPGPGASERSPSNGGR